MSVFGGDSWGREARYRKRRVDDLLVDGLDDSSYKQLSSGKFVCLVCSHNPILDTPFMLSMHIKGSRHLAAESRLKERELSRQHEIKKRIALSDSCIGATNTATSMNQHRLASKPLIKQTRKAASEILHNQTPQQTALDLTQNFKSRMDNSANGISVSNTESSSVEVNAADKEVVQQQSYFRERRERELKFIAAGWKRDYHGKWFRDENAEFDYDEEDPNVCLAL